MVTKEDIIKIIEHLKYYLNKESNFTTETSITDDDYFSFLNLIGDDVYQNCKIKVSDLKKYLGNSGSSGNTPTTVSIYIDKSTNHWIINGEDTGINATGPMGPMGPSGEDGKNGTNGVDGYNGLPGENGDVYIKKFTKTSSLDVKPSFTANNINPGSIWSAWLPEYNTGEAVWEIVARVSANNTLVENWSGPILMTGIPGPSGGEAATPNWKLTIYTESNSIPNPPTNTNPDYYTINTDWKPYPTSQGNWWQCICSVDGPTNIISHFSDVILLNGKDGKDGENGKDGQNGLNGQDGKDGQNGLNGSDGADGKDGIDGKDGKYTEFRFTQTDSSLTPPKYTASSRNPSISGTSLWSVVVPTQIDGNYIWMIQAIINSDETLYQNWSVPICVTIPGPQGETGPTGPQGPGGINGLDGINGVSMEFRYMVGTEDNPKYSWSNSLASTREPANWSVDIPNTSDNYPYIWFIQTRISDYSKTNIGTLEANWSTPQRLSGVNGLDGKDGSVGRAGQIVYPAGIYSVDTTYSLDDYKAPYVFDPQDGNYYVLNVSRWTGKDQDENNNTPAKNVALQGDEWVKLEAFEAIYAKVGIIANGLIGSAVFNGNYMFSQQGIIYTTDDTGEIYSYNSSAYESFVPSTINLVLSGSTPLDTFIPNVMFDLSEGTAWFGASDCTIDAEGNIITNKLATQAHDIILPSINTPNLWNTTEGNDLIMFTPYMHTIVRNGAYNYPVNEYGDTSKIRTVVVRLANFNMSTDVWYEGSVSYTPYKVNSTKNEYIKVDFNHLIVSDADNNALVSNTSKGPFYLGGKYTTIKFRFKWNGIIHGGLVENNANPMYCLGDLHVINGITKVEDLFDIEKEDTPSVDIESIQALVNSLQTELNNAKSELATMKSTVDRNNSSVTSLTSRMNSVENEVSEHTSTITDLESRVTQLEQIKYSVAAIEEELE